MITRVRFYGISNVVPFTYPHKHTCARIILRSCHENYSIRYMEIVSYHFTPPIAYALLYHKSIWPDFYCDERYCVRFRLFLFLSYYISPNQQYYWVGRLCKASSSSQLKVSHIRTYLKLCIWNEYTIAWSMSNAILANNYEVARCEALWSS